MTPTGNITTVSTSWNAYSAILVVAVALLAACIPCTCKALYLPGAEEIITNIKNTLDPDGGYSFNYKTSQGIEREEKGSFENGIWTVKGIVSWIAPDNKIYGYQYQADDKGYQQIDMEPEDGDTRVDPKTKSGLLG